MPLKKHLRELLLCSREYLCPHLELPDFQVEIQKNSALKISIGQGSQKKEVTEYISAWLLFCSKFWALVQSEPKDSGLMPSMISLVNKKPGAGPWINWDVKKSEALIGIGHELIKLGHQKEGEQCFFSALMNLASKDFKTLLQKRIPVSYHDKYQKFYSTKFLREEYWQGKKSMGHLAGAKTVGEMLQKYPAYEYQAAILKKFYAVFSLGSPSGSDQTGKGIDKVVQESIVTCCESEMGVIKAEATDALEVWTVELFHTYSRSEQTKSKLYFCERILEYLPILESNGLSRYYLYQYKFWALLCLSRRDEAEHTWQAYIDYLKTEKISRLPGHAPFDDLDQNTYKAKELSAAAIVISQKKTISREEKAYALQLAQEAHQLKGKQSSEHTHYALSLSYELNGNDEEALKHLIQAAKLRTKHKYSWIREDPAYNKDIERLKRKLNPKERNKKSIDEKLLAKKAFLEESRKKTLDSGSFAMGKILDILHENSLESIPTEKESYYPEKLKMEIRFPEGAPVIASKVHLVPNEFFDFISCRAILPMKGDPSHAKDAEIDWEHFTPIDGKKALREIISEVQDLLKESGYKKTSPSNFNCKKAEGIVHVINFQSADGDSFTVNISVFVRAFWKAGYSPNEKNIQESDAIQDLRWRIGALIPKVKGDHWWRYDEGTENIIQELKPYLKLVLTFLEQFTEMKSIKQYLKNKK